MPCEQQYEPVHVKKQKRVSGPLSEKEVGWNEDDYQ